MYIINFPSFPLFTVSYSTTLHPAYRRLLGLTLPSPPTLSCTARCPICLTRGLPFLVKLSVTRICSPSLRRRRGRRLLSYSGSLLERQMRRVVGSSFIWLAHFIK
ncbi:ORF397 [White spot syndrome virus]|uniref:ORF397 n=1 Tax=White spot syndrome virus TaxID=342409 RepID=A0A2D3I5F7_9VIRU|nr:ORF397 [White spot syndrome virus]